MRLQLLVIAKEPVPGRVKTRLCPPCTPQQAAAVAAASLADTLRTVDASPVALRTLAICGNYRPPAGWGLVRQRGDGLGQRLAHAFADTALGAVFPGRIDVPVAERKRGCDDLAAIAERRCAEADGRDVGAVRG